MNPSRLIPPTFVVLWATGFIGARYAMPHAEPFTFLGLRFVLAFLLIGAMALMMRGRIDTTSAGHAIVAGALMHGVYLGAVFWAIRHGLPAGISALVVGLQPLLTALIAGVALGEEVRPRHWAGLAIGFAGVVLVLAPKLGDVSSGITAATLSASVSSVVAMSAGTVWQKRFVSGADPLASTMFQYLGGAVLMTIGAYAFETRQMDVAGELVFAMVWLVFVLSIGAIFLLMHLIARGEVAKVASLFYLVPAVTAVIAWGLFGETLTPVQLAGMVVAAAGVALASQSATRSRASL